MYDIVKLEIAGVVDRLKEKDFDIELSKDAIEIAGYGLFGTPAVVVDGEVKSVGKIPKKQDVIGWINP